MTAVETLLAMQAFGGHDFRVSEVQCSPEFYLKLHGEVSGLCRATTTTHGQRGILVATDIGHVVAVMEDKAARR